MEANDGAADKGAAKLLMNTYIANAIAELAHVDMALLDEFLEGQEAYHVLEPLRDPTAYRRDAEGTDRAYNVLRAARTFIKALDEYGAPDWRRQHVDA